MLYAILAAAAAETEGIHTPAPKADVLGYLFGQSFLPITNTLVTTWLSMALLLLIAFLTTRNLKAVPTGAQNFWETIVEVWIGLVDQTMGRQGRRFVPLIGTAFLFILFSNWLGVLPLKHFDLIDGEGHAVHIFRSANSDLNLTAAMAVIVIVLAEVMEFRSLGAGGYFKSLLVPNFLRWLEIFTRPLSLSFRLFGNIFAGEVLVTVMVALAPFALFPFLGLEVFVGLIQALIFSMLTLVFLTLATAHAHHDDHAPAHAAVDAAHAHDTAHAPSATAHAGAAH